MEVDVCDNDTEGNEINRISTYVGRGVICRVINSSVWYEQVESYRYDVLLFEKNRGSGYKKNEYFFKLLVYTRIAV